MRSTEQGLQSQRHRTQALAVTSQQAQEEEIHLGLS